MAEYKVFYFVVHHKPKKLQNLVWLVHGYPRIHKLGQGYVYVYIEDTQIEFILLKFKIRQYSTIEIKDKNVFLFNIFIPESLKFIVF
jgi:hypothetical protein